MVLERRDERYSEGRMTTPTKDTDTNKVVPFPKKPVKRDVLPEHQKPDYDMPMG